MEEMCSPTGVWCNNYLIVTCDRARCAYHNGLQLRSRWRHSDSPKCFPGRQRRGSRERRVHRRQLSEHLPGKEIHPTVLQLDVPCHCLCYTNYVLALFILYPWLPAIKYRDHDEITANCHGKLLKSQHERKSGVDTCHHETIFLLRYLNHPHALVKPAKYCEIEISIK